jgi:hypothetical protein
VKFEGGRRIQRRAARNDLSKDQNGHITGNNVHLSFDQYMQDQIFTIDAGRGDQQKYSELTMQDRGHYPILEVFEASDRISKVPRGQQASEWKKGRREVEFQVGMFLKKARDLLCLVRREVVEDDVDLLLGPA